MILFGAVVGVLAYAAPAWAHTTVKVEPAVAGAPDAVITVNAAAESDTAGITSLKVVLPEGLAPGDVTYVDGPPGWTLRAEADGYVVSGPPVPAGRDAVHRVRAKALPATPTLVFKVLQTYTDGRIDRWIEVPSAGNAEPEFPAPVVTLAAPPGGFPPPSDPQSSAAPAPDPVDPTTAAGPDVAEDSGSPLPWLILGAVLVAAVATAAVVVLRRRGTP
jgi:uncharacterized protein YcnI